MNKAAVFLLSVGLAQMTGDLLHVPAIKAIGAATNASPAPRVFSIAGGMETYSTRFFLQWNDRSGASHSLEITPEVYSKLKGPYNRRNVYGATVAYGPVLAANPKTKPMFDAVARYAMTGEAPMLQELGIDITQIEGPIRIRYDPLPGTDMGDLPRVLVIE